MLELDNLKAQISPNFTTGQKIEFQYDILNRVTQKLYPDGKSIDYVYDLYPDGSWDNTTGRLTQVSNLTGKSVPYYDNLGRTIKLDKTVNVDSIDVTYTTESTFDALGRTETLTYPDQTIVSYEYDTAGNLAKISDSTGHVYANYNNFNALGQVEEIAFGNGVTTNYQYHPTNKRLKSIKTGTATEDYMDQLYYYDDVGNIIRIEDNISSLRTRDYVYDDLDRLIEATTVSYGAYGGGLVYKYNRIGNMTYNCRYGEYEYDTNHPHAVKNVKKDGIVVADYSYDAAGNMTIFNKYTDNGGLITGGGRDFQYDFNNRTTSVTHENKATLSFYDESGDRVKKVVPGAEGPSTTVYIGKIYECTDGVCTKHILSGDSRIAQVTDTAKHYFHGDHLGSASIISDDLGQKAQDIFYYPYGEIQSNTISPITNKLYTGQEYDAEAGLYFYGARYYDPQLARFTSADSIVPYPFDSQSLSRYTYTRNNPIIHTDPDGHLFWVAVLIGAFIGGMSAAIQGGGVADILKGMIIGAMSAAVGYGVGSLVGNAISVGSALCQATVFSVVVGGAGGAAAGAAGAAMMGGDIGKGALIGMVGGAIGGALGIQGIQDEYLAGLAQVGSGAVAGGLTSELTGGDFWEGFKMGGVGAAAGMAANAFYKAFIKYESDPVVKTYRDGSLKADNKISKHEAAAIRSTVIDAAADAMISTGERLLPIPPVNLGRGVINMKPVGEILILGGSAAKSANNFGPIVDGIKTTGAAIKTTGAAVVNTIDQSIKKGLKSLGANEHMLDGRNKCQNCHK